MAEVKIQYCPNCAAVWDLEEMEDQRCGACAYPDNEPDEKEFDPDPLEDDEDNDGLDDSCPSCKTE
jgi:hypothetical protein